MESSSIKAQLSAKTGLLVLEIDLYHTHTKRALNHLGGKLAR